MRLTGLGVPSRMLGAEYVPALVLPLPANSKRKLKG